MSLLYHTTGIILSRNDHREVDSFYHAFTREHGKIEFLARGGRKPLAKLVPHLEFPAEVDLLLVNGRFYQTVAGVERRQAFFGLYQSFSHQLLVKNILTCVDIATKPHESDEHLYAFLLHWLSELDQTPELSEERSAFVLASFVLKLMAQIGYRPELRLCLNCHAVIVKSAYLFHALRGGVVCHSCATKEPEQWMAAKSVSDEAIQLLRFAFDKPFAEQLKTRLESEQVMDFHELVESLIVNHFPTIPSNSLRSASLA